METTAALALQRPGDRNSAYARLTRGCPQICDNVLRGGNRRRGACSEGRIAFSFHYLIRVAPVRMVEAG